MFRRHPGWARRAFTEADLDAITAAVREAERGTSAEIRVHIERRVAHGLRRRTSDAEAIVHQLVTGIPWMRLADRFRGRQNMPGWRNSRGERAARTLADAGEEWL